MSDGTQQIVAGEPIAAAPPSSTEPAPATAPPPAPIQAAEPPSQPAPAPSPLPDPEPPAPVVSVADFEALKAQFEANKAEQGKEIARLRGEARSRALDAAGIKPQYREFVPADFDLTTNEGLGKLEKWLDERPDLRGVAAVAPVELDESLKEVVASPLVDGKWFTKAMREA